MDKQDLARVLVLSYWIICTALGMRLTCLTALEISTTTVTTKMMLVWAVLQSSIQVCSPFFNHLQYYWNFFCMKTVRLELCDLIMTSTPEALSLGVLKCATRILGALCVRMVGTTRIVWWCADSWDGEVLVRNNFLFCTWYYSLTKFLSPHMWLFFVFFVALPSILRTIVLRENKEVICVSLIFGS